MSTTEDRPLSEIVADHIKTVAPKYKCAVCGSKKFMVPNQTYSLVETTDRPDSPRRVSVALLVCSKCRTVLFISPWPLGSVDGP